MEPGDNRKLQINQSFYYLNITSIYKLESLEPLEGLERQRGTQTPKAKLSCMQEAGFGGHQMLIVSLSSLGKEGKSPLWWVC